MLFKTNTNGHSDLRISLFIIEQDRISEIKENNKWHSAQEPRTVTGCSFTNTERHSLCMYIYVL